MNNMYKLLTLCMLLLTFQVTAASLAELKAQARWGNNQAAFQVARAYDTGNGVSKDGKTAMQWYEMAAKRDDATSQVFLGLQYAIGEVTEKNMPLAYAWFKLAELNQHDAATFYRNKAEQELSPEQKVKAQQLYQQLLAEIKPD